MRISQSMITRDILQSTKIRRENLYDINRRISTLKKVQKGSDDPVKFSRANRNRSAYEQNLKYINNVQNAEGWLDVTIASIDQLHTYAVEAKNLAITGADGNSNGDVRAAIAQQIRGILEEAVTVGNTQYLDKSIFAGTNTKNNTPFELSGTTVTYTGNDEDITRDLSQNMNSVINETGQTIFDTNIFTALENLVVALEADDQAGIESALGEVNTSEDNLLNISTQKASFRSSLDLIENRLENSNLKLIEEISDDEDAILEEEYINLKSEEIAYQAALQSSAEIMQLNILSYL